MTVSLDATVRAYDRMVEQRLAAGWDFDPDYGWGSPDGLTESEWADKGWPFPEDPEFADWFSTFYHYDALDEGVEPNPYPNAPAPSSD